MRRICARSAIILASTLFGSFSLISLAPAVASTLGANCPAQNVFWSSSNATCHAMANATNVGSSVRVSASGSASGSGNGNATFTCSNAKFTLTSTTGCAPGAAFYVSPNGNDANNGTWPSSPFRTLEKAQAAMEGSSYNKTTYLLGGSYKRTTPLSLSNSTDNGETWLAWPGQTPVLDGGGTLGDCIDVTQGNIIIHGLTVQNCANNGIYVKWTNFVTIDGNTVSNINNIQWANAGIFFLKVQNSQQTNNTVSYTAGDGMAVNGGTPGDNNSNDIIAYNVVSHTCTAVSDCGAIDFRDSGHVSTGMMALNNLVYNFGTLGSSAGIYLDDETSWMIVANNIIAGPGQYGLIIHGGNNDIVVSNIIDTSSIATLALYQDDWGVGGPNYGMAGNIFSHNIIYSSGAVPGWWILNQTDGIASPVGNIVNPTVSDNLYYSATSVYNMTVDNALVSAPSKGVYTTVKLSLDSSPQYGNPLFINPQANNYGLQPGSPAYNVGFVPSIN